MESQDSTAKAEHIIETIAGCGRFQIILFMSFVVITKSLVSYSIMFMAYGNYNPGWRCLDNVTFPGSIPTTQAGLVTTRMMNSSTRNTTAEDLYIDGSCKAYEKCDDVEFNPASSTIVTEWGLVCDRSWIVSLIISIQMLGMLIGAYFGGQLADLIGRKKMLCLGVVVCGVSHLISSFSVSWVMFLVLRFIVGTFASSDLVIMFLYLSEFMTRKWRALSIAAPLWYVGATMLAFVAWLVKDWRQIEMIGTGLYAVSLVPLVWFAPESIRWLEVKNKKEDFIAVSRKILKLNKKEEPSYDQWNFNVATGNKKKTSKHYTIFDLFRKGYKWTTVIVMFIQFSSSLLYYALSFGAKSLYGNFYFNLFVMSMIPVPFGFLSMYMLRVISRRWHTLLFMAITVACAVVSIGILLVGNDAAKDFGSTVLISLAKATLDVAWLGVFARNAELYPTVARGVAVGAGSMTARVGGIIAPFLVPADKSQLYILMIIMSVLTVICCASSLKLPETKNKVLKETFHDDDSGDDVSGSKSGKNGVDHDGVE